MNQRHFIDQIVREPGEDSPRLAYADWLEENAGDVECPDCRHRKKDWGRHYKSSPYCICKGSGRISDSYTERAEFIRVQVELAELGKPHIIVTEPCILESRYGPNYFTLTGGEETTNGRLIFEAQVGRRVDVMKPKYTKNKKPVYGLRIHKISDDEIIVVKDAKSQPWGGEKLQDRSHELLHLHGERWAMEELHRPCRTHDLVNTFRFVWSRGFIGRVECTTETLMGRHGGSVGGQGLEYLDSPGIAKALGENVPVTEVVLTDRSPSHNHWNKLIPNDPSPSRVPIEIFHLLRGYRNTWGPQDKESRAQAGRGYGHTEEALSALALAAADYCRQLAGLPLLPPL